MKSQNKINYSDKLVVIDFDGTITTPKFHSHNILANYNLHGAVSGSKMIKIFDGKLCDSKQHKKYDEKQIFTTLDLFYGSSKMSSILRDVKFKDSYNKLISSGAKVAIASFNQYPAAIKWLLQKADFSEEEIKSIPMILGGISSTDYKNLHLKALQDYYKNTHNITFLDHQVILIDDDYSNILAAKTLGYVAMYAKDNGLIKFSFEEALFKTKTQQNNLLDDDILFYEETESNNNQNNYKSDEKEFCEVIDLSEILTNNQDLLTLIKCGGDFSNFESSDN